MNIEKKLIKYNFTINTNKPKYIVIHDTGNKSQGAGADNHYSYFNGGNRGASAHFFVDDKKILQVVEIKDSAWHCGKWYVATPKIKDCNNNNSIGIEICVNSDCDIDKAIKNTQELVLYLMKQYNITEDRVITHRDCTGKNCPANLTWIISTVDTEKIAYENAVDKLFNNKIISDKKYWIELTQDNVKADHVKTLIKNIASSL